VLHHAVDPIVRCRTTSSERDSPSLKREKVYVHAAKIGYHSIINMTDPKFMSYGRIRLVSNLGGDLSCCSTVNSKRLNESFQPLTTQTFVADCRSSNAIS
jgi:hypothetical protein